jgi:RNA binding activity-knot of a chromodomain
MPIMVRCSCGKTLQAPDATAGSRIRCGNCKAVVAVPDFAPTESRVRSAGSHQGSVAPARRRPEPEVDTGVAPDRPRPPKRSAGISPLWIIALLGVAGVLLLGCLLIGGVAAYFIGFSGGSAESQLIGDWEMDPEPFQKAASKAPFGVGMMPDVKLTFNKDHTFRLLFLVEHEGRWQVVSRSGNRLQVKLTMKVIGMDQNNPPTATITLVDKDHIDFSADERSMQLAGRFRRVGTGPPIETRSISPAAAAPRDKGNGIPGVDEGMKPDCEVLWGGVWYDAKVLKKEKDRWFIHYVGWGSNFDEWVGKDKIRFKK